MRGAPRVGRANCQRGRRLSRNQDGGKPKDSAEENARKGAEEKAAVVSLRVRERAGDGEAAEDADGGGDLVDARLEGGAGARKRARPRQGGERGDRARARAQQPWPILERLHDPALRAAGKRR